MNIFINKQNSNYDCEEVDYFIDLDKKINHFYSWVDNKSGYYVKEVKSLIEKVVLWYEFRYSNNYFDFLDVDKFLIGDLSSSCNKTSWCNLFDYNKFSHRDMAGSCESLQWCDLFNYDKFYYILSDSEKKLLDKPKFPNFVELQPGSRSHLHVDDNGIINDGDDVWVIKRDRCGVMSCGCFLNGSSLREFKRINIENNLGLDTTNIERIVGNVEYKESFRNGILDTIMYRIIESGGKYYGPRRAVLFAREFGINLEKPIKYGDSGLISEYLENNGNGDLICYPRYFDDRKDDGITANELLSCQNLLDSSNKIKRKVFK